MNATRLRGWRAEVAAWPEEDRDDWEERSAIREYSGNQERHAAEWAAYRDVKLQREIRQGKAVQNGS